MKACEWGQGLHAVESRRQQVKAKQICRVLQGLGRKRKKVGNTMHMLNKKQTCLVLASG